VASKQGIKRDLICDQIIKNDLKINLSSDQSKAFIRSTDLRYKALYPGLCAWDSVAGRGMLAY
jgi:hypothetical protein